MKKIITVAAIAFLSLSLAGCGGEEKDPGPDYADDEAMEIIAEGFEARQDTIALVEKQGDEDPQSMKNLKSYVDAELQAANKLRTRVFEDTELQEQVLTYINTLDDTRTLFDKYSVTSTAFTDAWSKLGDERAILLKKFADEYGLAVDEKYREALDEILANGAEATRTSQVQSALEQLIGSITFDKKTEYGTTTYSAVVENTIGIDLVNCVFDVSLYDADGVKAEESYIDIASWAAGEKVRFECMAQTDAPNVKLTINHYETAQ